MIDGRPLLVRHVRGLVLARDHAGMSDAALLESFLRQGEEAAFATLVRRHGPMVLSVCRRILGDPHDAEDAFQATFFVLVRKAASIRQRELLGNWLYGVACRTALEARTLAARRRARERQVRDMPQSDVIEDALGQDWRPALDLELRGLPDKYRAPIVLCDLEGLSRRDAARRLGCPEGTLSGRLARARRLLARRLAKHGVTLSAGALATSLSHSSASAAVPTSLSVSTVKAATAFAAGQAAPVLVSAKVAALTEGVVKAMLLTKLKLVTAVMLVVALASTGVAAVLHPALSAVTQDEPAQTSSPKPKKSPQQSDAGTLKQLEPEKAITILSDGGRIGWLPVIIAGTDNTAGRFTLIGSENTGGVSVRLNYAGLSATEVKHPLAPAVRVVVDGKDGKLSDLTPETPVQLTLDGGKVTKIEAVGATHDRVVHAVDSTHRTITVREGSDDSTGSPVKHLLADDAQVFIDGKKSRLPDLTTGMKVQLQISAVKPIVRQIRATGPLVEAIVQKIDLSRRTLTVRVAGLDLLLENLPLTDDAFIQLGDKKSRLDDLKPGMKVTLQMSAERDRNLVVGVSAPK